MMAGFEDIPTEEFEIEVGEAPQETVAPSIDVLEAEKRAAVERAAQLEREAEMYKQQSNLSQMAELTRLREERELLEKREKMQREQGQAPTVKTMTPAERRVWTEEFVKDPELGMQKFEEYMMQGKVLPLVQALYAEVEGVKSATQRQAIMADPMNKLVMEKYGKDVDATLQTLGNIPNKHEIAVNIVKGQRFNELMTLQGNGTGSTSTPTASTPTPPASNANPNVQGVPMDGTTPKKKVWVKPELMQQKPRGVTDNDWVEYLKEKGLVK